MMLEFYNCILKISKSNCSQHQLMCNYTNILKLFGSIFLAFLTIYCNAQGSWDIGYINVDSINRQHVGMIVRLDFKSINPFTSSDGQRHIRSYIGTKDTGSVSIDKSLITLIERRKIYVDHGSYNDQYLECINCRQDSLFIYDAKILGVDQQIIHFQIDIEIKKDNQLLKKQVSILVDRSKLDGLMYKL
jgi:hypothetical protein